MSETPFFPMEGNAADYRRPVVQALAQPGWYEWFGHKNASEGSAFLGKGESFSYGRYALAEAMHRVGIGPGKTVLLPAFHCRAIVEPALYLGADPHFYPVTADLKPDFEVLSQMIDTGLTPAAMVITHYFGFPNALEETELFCRTNGISLIEDCAHALYGQDRGRLLGTVGKYSVASLWKFLPVRDGAILLDNEDNAPRHRSIPQSIPAELKSLAGLLESWVRQAWHRDPLSELDRPTVISEADRIAGRGITRIPEPGLKEFLPGAAGTAALRSSLWLSTVAAHGRVADLRRANYLTWLNGVQGLKYAIPLFPELPAGIVPYAFPLLVDRPEFNFHRLKVAGVPLWRWEDMAVTSCAVSRDYRLRLVQLPCHQSLRAAELAWLIRSVQTLLSDKG